MASRDQDEQFVRLLSKYQQRIYAFILTLEPNWADAEEVLQETSAVLWRKFSQFDPATDFVRWGCQVAYFELLRMRQKRKRDRLVFNEQLLESLAADSLAISDVLDEQRKALADCKQALSEKDRKLIEMRYQPGVSVQSLASDSGRSVDAVYKALQRIRAALLACIRQKLPREGGS